EHLWAESYNRTLDDVFGVEGEVANAIADQLNAKLSGAEQKAVAEKPTQNAAAYDAYLRAIAIDNEGNLDTTKRVADLYVEAVRRLPNSALVLEQMAHLERRLGQFDVAQNHYQAAAELDPRNIDILLTLADALQTVRPYDDARAALDRALEIAPGNEGALAVK